MKDTLIRLGTKILKVAGYLFLSWFISLPVQEALMDWLSVNISDPAIIGIINLILVAITSELKEKFGKDSLISKLT